MKAFWVDRYGDSKSKVEGDILRPIPPVEKRSVLKQLVDNFKCKWWVKIHKDKAPDAGIQIRSSAEL